VTACKRQEVAELPNPFSYQHGLSTSSISTILRTTNSSSSSNTNTNLDSSSSNGQNRFNSSAKKRCL
jgi:hypothetical protein